MLPPHTFNSRFLTTGPRTKVTHRAEWRATVILTCSCALPCIDYSTYRGDMTLRFSQVLALCAQLLFLEFSRPDRRIWCHLLSGVVVFGPQHERINSSYPIKGCDLQPVFSGSASNVRKRGCRWAGDRRLDRGYYVWSTQKSPSPLLGRNTPPRYSLSVADNLS